MRETILKTRPSTNPIRQWDSRIATTLGVLLLMLLSGLSYGCNEHVAAQVSQPLVDCDHVEVSWSQTEAWTWKRLCTGEEANLRDFVPPTTPDADGPRNSEHNATLSGAFIETILTVDMFRAPLAALPQSRITINNAIIDGKVDLTDAVIPVSISITNTEFLNELTLVSVHIRGNLELSGSTLGGVVVMTRANIEEGLNLTGGAKFFAELTIENADISGRLSTYGSSFDGAVSLAGSRIGGGLSLQSTTFDILKLDRADVTGSVDLRSSTVGRTLTLRGAAIGQDFVMANIHLTGPLIAVGVNIEGNIEGFDAYVEGRINFAEADLGGSAAFKGTHVLGELSMKSANLRGSLDLSGVHAARVILTESNIDGSLILRAAEIEEMVIVRGNISSQLNILDSEVGRVDGRYMEVGGTVVVRDTATRDIDLRHAVLDGELVIEESLKQMGEPPVAITKVDLQRVDLRWVDVRTVLVLSGSVRDLDLRNAHVGGEVNLIEADIARSAAFGDADITTLRLAGTNGEVSWAEESWIDLRGTTIGNLVDSKTSWPKKAHLNGLTYGSVGSNAGGNLVERESSWLIGWLQSDAEFTRQPYQYLEEALRSIGRDSTADEVAIARQTEERKTPSGAFGSAWRWLYQYTVGFGYRPVWSFFWLVAFLVLGSVLLIAFDPGVGVECAVVLSFNRLLPALDLAEPKRREVVLTSETASNKTASNKTTSNKTTPRAEVGSVKWRNKMRAHYNGLGNGHDRTGIPRRRRAALLRWYFHVHTIFGWVLTGFLLAAVGGAIFD